MNINLIEQAYNFIILAVMLTTVLAVAVSVISDLPFRTINRHALDALASKLWHAVAVSILTIGVIGLLHTAALVVLS